MQRKLFKERLKMLPWLQNFSCLDELTAFSEYLLEENAKLNLTAITEEGEFALKHIADSLTGEKLIPAGARVVDVGTGAGFPGMVLAIARPDILVTLNDSIQKKCDFLQRAVTKLGLKNVEVICGRAEELGKQVDHRESYDVAVSRAVARLSSLAELCIPLVKVGGVFIAYKGAEGEAELAEATNGIAKLGGKAAEPISVNLAGNKRLLVVVEKVQTTPECYPRTAKKIATKPLS